MQAGPGNRPHLWIVVTDPLPTGETIVVSVTTLRHAAEQTVVLGPSDHSFIRHQSCVHFGDARILDGTRLDVEIQHARIQNHDPCTEQLTDEIEDGLWSSPHTPRKVLNFLEELEEYP